MNHVLNKTFEIAEKYISDHESRPVLPYQSPEKMAQRLDLHLGEEGMSETHFFQLLEQIILATPKTAGEGFYNQLFGGRNFIAVAGEILAAVMNNSMYTYKVAGPQILLEKEVLRKMLSKIGWEETGEGAFAPGGSMTNLIAMIIARNEKFQSIRNEGFNGMKLTAYTSVEGHYSIMKNAGIIGIGRHNVRHIPSDITGKMRPDALRSQILTDIQDGFIPFFINATASTTVLGAFDPFHELHKIAKEFGLWMHTDGAFGGSAIMSQRHKHLLDGAELSDSFSWNAHKMMSVPLTASVILFPKKGLLNKHISEHADYLFQSDEDDYNPGLNSIQCGRKNDALKVWASWKYFGDEGYEKRINHLFELAQYAVEAIKSDSEFELFQEPEGTTVCFEVAEKSSKEICHILDQKGILKVGYGSARGRTFIRVAFVNPEITFANVDDFFEKIRQVAKELAPTVESAYAPYKLF